MAKDDPTSLPGRWKQFIIERFSPLAYIFTVTCFVMGNGTIAIHLQGATLSLPKVVVSLLLTVSFFFRLRCFDEIKDLETDCRINPSRPLARGLLTPPQVMKMILSLTLFELILAASLSRSVLLVHATAIAYSYLMFKEFFIGRILVKHLTTYAVTHTFVSVLIGYSIIAQMSGQGLDEFSRETLVFSLLNWTLFNLFEFARKTYAPEEERDGVDSYSSIFSPIGAALLSLSQVGCALVILNRLPANILETDFLGLSAKWLQFYLALLPCLSVLIYTVRPTRQTAELFRNLTAVYLPLFYTLLAFQALT